MLWALPILITMADRGTARTAVVVPTPRPRCPECGREFESLLEHDVDLCASRMRVQRAADAELNRRATLRAAEERQRAEERARRAIEDERAIWGMRGRPTSARDERLNLPRKLRPPPGVDRIRYVELLRRGFDRTEALDALELAGLPRRELDELVTRALAHDPSVPEERRTRVLGILAKLAGVAAPILAPAATP